MSANKNTKKLFSNPDILEESITIVDSMTRIQEKEGVKIAQQLAAWVKKLENSKHKKSLIAAYIGPFGSGKSTVLNAVSQATQNNYLWLQFDIWRYSDRRQIWDGFVIEAVHAINESDKLHKDKSDTLFDVADRIDGVRFNWVSRKLQNNPLQAVLTVIAVWLVLSTIIWLLFRHPVNFVQLWGKALSKYAATMLFVLLAFLGINDILPKPGRPLRRIFELENKFNASLELLEKPLVVVVEDTDRAGDESFVFLETLKRFFSKNIDRAIVQQPVIVIAPQEITYFDPITKPGIEGVERMLKVYDASIYSGINMVSEEQIKHLLKKAELLADLWQPFEEVIEAFLQQYNSQLSLRKIKYILREVDTFVATYPSANPLIVLILAFAKHVVSYKDYQPGAQELLATKLKRERDVRVSGEGAGPFVPLGRLISKYFVDVQVIGQNIALIQVHFKQQEEEFRCEEIKSADGTVLPDRYILTFDSKYKLLLG